MTERPPASRRGRPSGAPEPKPRPVRLLEAAVSTFVRFGFRKTSMEEVARAARVSRQALYLHFATKEELFRAAVTHALDTGLDEASRCLADDALALEERITRAFERWTGPYVGASGAHMAELEAASADLVGPVLAEHEAKFVALLARTLRSAGLPERYEAANLSARQLAETLNAAARGLKHDASTPREFAERVGVAVRALCSPLRVPRRAH